MNKARKGFTLAEVLVTLAIIGVVAALTIPTLIQSTNSSKYQTSLKKAVSVLNQALLSAVANGTDASSCDTDAELANFFKPYLNVLRQDGAASETLWLSDGSKLKFESGAACSTADPSAFDPNAECYVLVDVNGDKGPNTVATTASPADIYVLGITASSVVPVKTATNTITVSFEDVGNAAQTITGSPLQTGNDASITAVVGNT